MLLVRKDSGINTLEDLRDKKIAIRSDHYLGEMFLDKLFFDQNFFSYSKYIDELVKTKKFSTAILNTFFKKVDAAIVPSYALDLVSELNPIVKNQLKVISKSDDIFIPIVALFHKDINPTIIKSFNEHFKELEKTPRGQNIMNLFKMKNLSLVEKNELDPMYKFYQDYVKEKEKK